MEKPKFDDQLFFSGAPPRPFVEGDNYAEKWLKARLAREHWKNLTIEQMKPVVHGDYLTSMRDDARAYYAPTIARFLLDEEVGAQLMPNALWFLERVINEGLTSKKFRLCDQAKLQLQEVYAWAVEHYKR
jgi:hypothetical protein